jgi:multidrug efflux system membrane fusion protein
MVDTTTGTVKLRAQFDNKNGALFPNQFVNTRLLVNTVDGVTEVPSGAIQHNGQAAFVYVISNGTANTQPASCSKDTPCTASVRNVKTGVSDAGMAAVQGLNPGEVVATSSFDKLQAGTKVVIAKGSAGANPAGGNTP